jgi:hypothetical protein
MLLKNFSGKAPEKFLGAVYKDVHKPRQFFAATPPEEDFQQHCTGGRI